MKDIINNYEIRIVMGFIISFGLWTWYLNGYTNNVTGPILGTALFSFIVGSVIKKWKW